MPERVIRTLDGKRGSFLLVGGVAYLFIGLSYVFSATSARQAAFQWLPDAFSPHTIGWVWVVGGAFAAIIALVSRLKRHLDRWGYAALMLCPLLWVVIFMGSTLTGVHPTGWVSAVAYGLMATWVWVVSGWDNPRPPVSTRTLRGGND